MATKKETITAEMIRQAYLAYSQRQPDPEAFVSFTEHELTAFIRQYFDAGFPGIYAQRDHNYYEKEIRGHIADTQERRDADMASGNKLSLHLKIYSHFLESKAFKSLARQSPASGSALPKTSTAQPASGETSPTSAGQNRGVGDCAAQPATPAGMHPKVGLPVPVLRHGFRQSLWRGAWQELY